MKENSIWRAVREGRAALGTGLKEFASRGVPWIIEASGFDYCMIDHEHGAFDLETIADLAGWFQATNVSAIVRIHKSFTYFMAPHAPSVERIADITKTDIRCLGETARSR
jgi:2-keto-3-deoxy-L-rhamnonate aldolase RhmA